MRVMGYGVCAVCRQTLHFYKGSTTWQHATPDISHKPVLKSWNNDWIDQ
jgi:hypothetical protein